MEQSGHGRLNVIDFLGMDVLLIFLRGCGCFSTSIMFHIPEKEKKDDKTIDFTLVHVTVDAGTTPH